MEALRSVRRLPNPCAAGSSWSYASTSTITPPTPSTYSCAPISSGATSCGLRRRSRLIPQEPRQGDGRDDAAGDARDAAGDDREAEGRERGEHPCLEVAEARRARHLHELDPQQPAPQVVGRRAQQHRAAEDGAVEVRTAGD